MDQKKELTARQISRARHTIHASLLQISVSAGGTLHPDHGGLYRGGSDLPQTLVDDYITPMLKTGSGILPDWLRT